MDITVCICTHDRPAYVRDCLEGLARQTAPGDRYEIVLVDSASTGDVPERLAALAQEYGARQVRVDRPGVGAARDAGAVAARGTLIAYIDDDAIPAPNWIEAILRAWRETTPRPALIGGRILPKWEAPLPRWWPRSLIGVLSIIEHEGQGTYRTAELPAGLEPYGANVIVEVEALRAAGGFGDELGRFGDVLLSDEEVRLAWSLQDAGHHIVYDSRIVVHHQIQASRLNPGWLLRRLYWQGASTVTTRRMTRPLPPTRAAGVWRELPRRLAVIVLLGPVALLPRESTWLMEARWRVAYALGFARAVLGWRAGPSAARSARFAPDHDSGSHAGMGATV